MLGVLREDHSSEVEGIHLHGSSLHHDLAGHLWVN